MDIPKIRSIRHLRRKRVLLRSSLNVPIANGKVASMFRLKKAIRTIEYLQTAGAKVILVGHLGRNAESMVPVYEALRKETPVSFCPFSFSDPRTKQALASLEEGEVVLLENIRREEGEESNSEEFAKELAACADIYVNDAFAASHRRHASVFGITKYIPSYAGELFIEEYNHLFSALSPQHPALMIIAGAKFETKEPLIKKSLAKYDDIFVGGALANDFFKACSYEVGSSLISSSVVNRDLVDNKNILLPKDVSVLAHEGVITKAPQDVTKNEVIVDAGPETIFFLKKYIDQAAFVLWNGPLGNYEKGFSAQTEALARIIAQSDAKSIVGGGDTIAAIESLNLEEEFSFVSTAGGAMIKFLTYGTLPGIEALKKTR